MNLFVIFSMFFFISGCMSENPRPNETYDSQRSKQIDLQTQVSTNSAPRGQEAPKLKEKNINNNQFEAAQAQITNLNQEKEEFKILISQQEQDKQSQITTLTTTIKQKEA